MYLIKRKSDGLYYKARTATQRVAWVGRMDATRLDDQRQAHLVINLKLAGKFEDYVVIGA